MSAAPRDPPGDPPRKTSPPGPLAPVPCWQLDGRDREVFLYAYLRDLSSLGVFVPTLDPLPVGAPIEIAFAASRGEALRVGGQVQWVNPPRPRGLNPGMGVALAKLDAPLRELLVEAVRTIAYLR